MNVRALAFAYLIIGSVAFAGDVDPTIVVTPECFYDAFLESFSVCNRDGGGPCVNRNPPEQCVPTKGSPCPRMLCVSNEQFACELSPLPKPNQMNALAHTLRRQCSVKVLKEVETKELVNKELQLEQAARETLLRQSRILGGVGSTQDASLEIQRLLEIGGRVPAIALEDKLEPKSAILLTKDCMDKAYREETTRAAIGVRPENYSNLDLIAKNCESEEILSRAEIQRIVDRQSAEIALLRQQLAATLRTINLLAPPAGSNSSPSAASPLR